MVKVLPLVLEESEKINCLVASLPSIKTQEAAIKDLLERVSVVALPTKVSVEVGRVKVPLPLVMVEMTGAVEKVLAPVTV